jgi:hypothetical protein
LSRDILRRLERLEARVWPVQLPTLMIYFVNPEKEVTRTLLLEAGKQVWRTLEGQTKECQPAAPSVEQTRS